MHRLTKLVHTTTPPDLIPCCQKRRQISCQAGGFAGDVDDVFYSISKDLWQGFGVDSIAWGIQDDHVGLLSDVVQDFQDVTGDETAVGEAVQGGVYFGSFYGFFHNFHANHFFRYGSKKLGNGSGAALEIEYLFLLGIANVIKDNGVKYLRCQ